MPILTANVMPGGGPEPGLYIGDELASPVAGLPAGTRLSHLHAILLYTGGVDKVKLLDRPNREKQQPIFSRKIYSTFAKYPNGAVLFERGKHADYLFYDLAYDRFLAIDAIGTNKYSTTFQIKSSGAYLKIPIKDLVVKVGEKYEGYFVEVPYFATDIITQLCLGLFEMNTNFVVRQNAIKHWDRPHGNLIRLVGFIYNNFVSGVNIKEAAIQQIIGPDNLKEFKDSARTLKTDYLPTLTAQEMIDAVGVPRDVTEALGMEMLKEFFGDDAGEQFKEAEFTPQTDNPDELFAQAEKAQKELEALMSDAGAGEEEKESEVVIESEETKDAGGETKAKSLLAKAGKENIILDFKKGDVIIEQGGGSDEVYVILDGKIDIFIQGVETPVATLVKNDFFGYMLPFIRDLGAQYSKFERSANVIASGPVKVLAMTKKGFTGMISHRPFYAINLMKQIQRDIDRMLRDKNLTREEYEELQHRMAQIEKYEKALRTMIRFMFTIREELKSQAADPFLSKLFNMTAMAEKDYFFEPYIPSIKEMRRATQK